MVLHVGVVHVWMLVVLSSALPAQHPMVLGPRHEATLALIVFGAAEAWVVVVRGIQF